LETVAEAIGPPAGQLPEKREIHRYFVTKVSSQNHPVGVVLTGGFRSTINDEHENR